MSLQALTYWVVGLSFALYIAIAIWSRAHSTGDFYIAGKGVSPVANGMATAADWMSAASFISMAGLIAFLGYDGSVYLMGWTGGYVLLALLLVYGVLGSSHNGRFDLKLVAFPTLVWLAMWAVAFGLGEYFARAFADAYPSFTVLGFHPSFAAIILLFWLLPTLLMGFGFEWVKDRWLSSGQWEEYLHRVHEAAAEERGKAGSE